MKFEKLYNKVVRYRYDVGDSIVYNRDSEKIVLKIVKRKKVDGDDECYYKVKKKVIDCYGFIDYYNRIESESYIRKKELNGRMCDCYEI